MFRSIETMARDMLSAYMNPLVINGKKIMDGWPVDIAARKACAAHPDFKDEIIKQAERIKNADSRSQNSGYRR